LPTLISNFYFPVFGKFIYLSHKINPMDRNQIALENIKTLRKSNKYSMEKLAARVNKSKSAYDRIEKGEVELTLNDAEAISKALGSDFNTITNAGMVFNIDKSSIICQGSNPTINIKLDDEQFGQLLDKLK
jgi:transcriptional regulator with XRE-family HTH domain